MNQTIRTEQRFIDREHTRPLNGSFNVYQGKRYIGIVYQVGDAWQYGTMQHERCHSFDGAVQKKVARYESLRKG